MLYCILMKILIHSELVRWGKRVIFALLVVKMSSSPGVVLFFFPIFSLCTKEDQDGI